MDGGGAGISNGHNLTQAPERDGRVLITGGAGFIGTNVADRLLTLGRETVILDNFSRCGVDQNARWLKERHGRRVRVVTGDIRSRDDVRRCLDGVSHVFHFAAQVAVTTSIADPRLDFEVNAMGTLNLLEQMRRLRLPPSIVYTSTNKVYGGLSDIALRKQQYRYEPLDPEVRRRGVAENRPLDFHTPYGCSKGAADQYVLDYGRSFGVPGAVFRMSCIYGPHQFGTEDQGWVAHFLIRAIENQAITVYGDGLQVRDILFVDDLVDAFLAVWSNIGRITGRVFNVGGGPANTISLRELIELLARFNGKRPKVLHESGRTGDQLYYVSDLSAIGRELGWSPKVGVEDGIRKLQKWLALRGEPMGIAAS